MTILYPLRDHPYLSGLALYLAGVLALIIACLFGDPAGEEMP